MRDIQGRTVPQMAAGSPQITNIVGLPQDNTFITFFDHTSAFLAKQGHLFWVACEDCDQRHPQHNLSESGK